MSKLYIANTTKQDHDFVYRPPEDKSPRSQRIPAGGQQLVYREDTTDVLRVIVEQHGKYGLIDASTIDQAQPFIGLCYQFDKPIRVERIMNADEHNSDVLAERGLEIRKTQAAALYQQIEEAGGQEHGLNSLEIETVEQTKSDHEGLNEVVEVQGPRPARDPSEKRSRRNRNRGG